MEDTEIIPNGVVADPRTEDEKASDFGHEEILGAAVPTLNWQAKASWKTIDTRDQITSSSCGAQSSAKAITHFSNDTIMSASPIYKARVNFPSEGMYQQNVGAICVHKKTATEADCPSQKMTEAQMNDAVIPANLPFGIASYYFLPSREDTNMDLIAAALEAGHAIHVGFNSNSQEYSDAPVNNGQATTFSHFVVCIDKENYLLWNGEKAIVIDDSCAVSSTYKKSGQRIFTESFLKTRVWGLMALVPVTAVDPIEKPKHTFATHLVYGSTGADVIAWQTILQFEGFLPTTTSAGTPLPLGNFLSMTALATKKWQVAHGLMDFANETNLKNIQVGDKTIAAANAIYA